MRAGDARCARYRGAGSCRRSTADLGVESDGCAVIRIVSVRSPFDNPEIASARDLGRDASGRHGPARRAFDQSASTCREWERVARDVTRAGVCKEMARGALWSGRAGTGPLPGDASSTSTRPSARGSMPASEWPACSGYSESTCSPVCSASPAVSLRRYLSGVRCTPDDVAVRLHALALIVGDLAGAYNDAAHSSLVRPEAHGAGESCASGGPDVPGGSRTIPGLGRCAVWPMP